MRWVCRKRGCRGFKNYSKNTLNNLLDWKMLNEIIITIIASCLFYWVQNCPRKESQRNFHFCLCLFTPFGMMFCWGDEKIFCCSLLAERKLAWNVWIFMRNLHVTAPEWVPDSLFAYFIRLWEMENTSYLRRLFMKSVKKIWQFCIWHIEVEWFECYIPTVWIVSRFSLQWLSNTRLHTSRWNIV